jgi:DNA-binding transcriptional ArsR family regulator
MYAPRIQSEYRRRTVSRTVTAPAAPAPKTVPWHNRVGVYFVPVRELNDETRAAIRKARCQATWLAIYDALHDQARRGRTAAIQDAARQCVLDDVGVSGLSRYSGGLTPKTIRKHLDSLEAIGLIRRDHPPVQFTLKDGRLCKAKGQGREKARRIAVTVDADRHCRPGKAPRLAPESLPGGGGSYGESVPTSTPVLMGSPYPPSIDSNASRNTAAAADTDGVGAAAAATKAPGPTAGKAGGPEAASQEGEAMTFMPTLPPPRRARPESPRRQALKPRPRGLGTGPEPAPTPAKPQVRWRMADYQPSPYRRPQESRGGAGEAAAAVQAPPTPPEGDRPSGATAGSQGDAASAAPGRFRHQWRHERGLPTATASTPPGRPLDADEAMLAAIVRQCQERHGIA